MKDEKLFEKMMNDQGYITIHQMAHIYDVRAARQAAGLLSIAGAGDGEVIPVTDEKKVKQDLKVSGLEEHGLVHRSWFREIIHRGIVQV
eukprot:NODE_6317_length_364_cov_1.473016_g5596_i0.p1 GENE.NODE_6317_length_364_cov_1.473016_g5596_i0~~NODE_6317_length_364_cov_1.473016_g5596_i0.p1  ORF type:complete len:89 (+),score=14.23 NODE_6317_length_364_cov_1.473016_g5596_i0:58-324(+)